LRINLLVAILPYDSSRYRHTGKNKQSYFSRNRINFHKCKQKEEDSALSQNEKKGKEGRYVNFDTNCGIDRNVDCKVPNQNPANDERLHIDVKVGAFAVAGIGGGISNVEELSLHNETLSMIQQAPVTITNARVINDDIVSATPLEGLILNFSTRCWFISIVLLLLLMGIIISVIVLTRISVSDSKLDSEADILIQQLKALLSNKSRQELENPEAAASLALNWLYYSSNFNAYSFDRQVQRFVLAALFFSSNGRSWRQNKGWLTNEDECSWYQSYNASTCMNETLRILSL
jgi:hypothetical protein